MGVVCSSPGRRSSLIRPRRPKSVKIKPPHLSLPNHFSSFCAIGKWQTRGPSSSDLSIVLSIKEQKTIRKLVRIHIYIYIISSYNSFTNQFNILEFKSVIRKQFIYFHHLRSSDDFFWFVAWWWHRRVNRGPRPGTLTELNILRRQERRRHFFRNFFKRRVKMSKQQSKALEQSFMHLKNSNTMRIYLYYLMNSTYKSCGHWKRITFTMHVHIQWCQCNGQVSGIVMLLEAPCWYCLDPLVPKSTHQFFWLIIVIPP